MRGDIAPLSYLLETCLKSLTRERPAFSLRGKDVKKMVLKERGYEGREIYSSSTRLDKTAYASFDRSNPTADEQLQRPPEDLSNTDSSMADRHARAFTAVSAYGTSVALNKTRQRPVSAKVTGSQGQVII